MRLSSRLPRGTCISGVHYPLQLLINFRPYTRAFLPPLPTPHSSSTRDSKSISFGEFRPGNFELTNTLHRLPPSSRLVMKWKSLRGLFESRPSSRIMEMLINGGGEFSRLKPWLPVSTGGITRFPRGSLLFHPDPFWWLCINYIALVGR